LAVPLVLAQSGYDLSWWTVDGGGGASSGGDFSLSGTIGQPDTGVPMSGGEYALTGGFWAGAGSAPSGKILYLPIVNR
jgi:hypothetical protein